MKTNFLLLCKLEQNINEITDSTLETKENLWKVELQSFQQRSINVIWKNVLFGTISFDLDMYLVSNSFKQEDHYWMWMKRMKKIYW